LIHGYNDIICLDNLLLAWQEFIVGKKARKDVQEFSLRLIANFDIKAYTPSSYLVIS